MAFIDLPKGPTDPQTLLTEAECLACIASGTLWPMMRLTLLLDLYAKYTRETMPDAKTLADETSCYECYGPNDYTVRLMELALLRRILLAIDPDADVTPQTLLDESTCYNCYGSTSIENLLELAMLSRLSQ